MSYKEAYKRMLQAKGGSVLDSDEMNTKNNVIRKFKHDPSYKKAILTKLDLTEEELDIRIVNVDRSTSDKKIYVLPNTVIEVGSFIKVGTTTYVVMEFEPNLISPFCKCLECNQTLNYKGLSKPIPCYATNSSYGTKGVVDLNQITVFEAKILFYTQWNKDTAKIRQDMRFIFNNDKYSVYQVVDIGRVTTGNVLRLVMNKVEYIESKDDLANNIAYNDFLEGNTPTPPPINPDTYNIKPSSGDFTINKYGSKTFTICDGSGVPSIDTWNIELLYNGVPTNHIEVVSKTNNAIRIKNNLGASDSIPKIKFTKGNITIETEVRLIR